MNPHGEDAGGKGLRLEQYQGAGFGRQGGKGWLEDHGHWRLRVAGAHWEPKTGGLGGSKGFCLEGTWGGRGPRLKGCGEGAELKAVGRKTLDWRDSVRRGPRMEGRCRSGS